MDGTLAIERGGNIKSAAGDDKTVDKRRIIVHQGNLIGQNKRYAACLCDYARIVFAQRIPGKFGISPRIFGIYRDGDKRSLSGSSHGGTVELAQSRCNMKATA